MNTSVPTVRVVSKAHKDGFVLINADDFDEKEHKLYEAESTRLTLKPKGE